ncbi:MAG: hypothetical protein RIM33_11865 [Alphaproteobacteria bacterium]
MTILDRLSIAFGAPPWMVVISLFFIAVILVGFSLFVRERYRGNGGPNWRRDPDEMEDLSPSLRRARMQMIAAVIGMFAIFVIAVLNLV